MGPDSAHEESGGRIPPQGGPQDDGAATVERTGLSLVLPPAGVYYGRGGFSGGVDLRLPPPEHSHAVYC